MPRRREWHSSAFEVLQADRSPDELASEPPHAASKDHLEVAEKEDCWNFLLVLRSIDGLDCD